MKSWMERPREVSYLLNPAFCNIILTSAVLGYSSVESKGMPYSISFMTLPIVLHKATREKLPRTLRTNLSAWLEDNYDLKIMFPDRVNSLVPIVKEAILFGTLNNWLSISKEGRLKTNMPELKIINYLKNIPKEIDEFCSKGRFVGRWFASTGSANTIMYLWGVKP